MNRTPGHVRLGNSRFPNSDASYTPQVLIRGGDIGDLWYYSLFVGKRQAAFESQSSFVTGMAEGTCVYAERAISLTKPIFQFMITPRGCPEERTTLKPRRSVNVGHGGYDSH